MEKLIQEPYAFMYTIMIMVIKEGIDMLRVILVYLILIAAMISNWLIRFN